MAKSAGLRPVPVPVDGGGIQPSHLALAFAATSARALYLQPNFQNPTGMTLAEDHADNATASISGDTDGWVKALKEYRTDWGGPATSDALVKMLSGAKS